MQRKDLLRWDIKKTKEKASAMQKQDIPRISGSPRRKNSPSQWIAIWLSRMLFSSQQWYRNQNYGLFTATSDQWLWLLQGRVEQPKYNQLTSDDFFRAFVPPLMTGSGQSRTGTMRWVQSEQIQYLGVKALFSLVQSWADWWNLLQPGVFLSNWCTP